MGYHSSAALLRLALDPPTLDVVEAVLGPDVELFLHGQVPYKEPHGGYLKHLHQDAAYFDHQGEGPLAVLVYGVDTDLTNGALHVIPGSHRQGTLRHIAQQVLPFAGRVLGTHRADAPASQGG